MEKIGRLTGGLMLSLKKNDPAGCVAFVSLMFVVFGLNGCSTQDKHSEQMAVIGTFVRVDVCRQGHRGEKIQKAMAQVWDRFEEIGMRMNAYDSASDVGRINEAAGRPVGVHEDVYKLIQDSRRFSKQTSGAFDVTVRPLVDLWQNAEEHNKIPSQEKITQVLKKVGVGLIRFPDPASERLVACDEGCRIDLGGIAKGYAVDEAAGILRSHGIKDFLIDAGGDMYAGGTNCKGRAWRVALQHPRSEQVWADILDVSDAAVTTSGDYRQFYEIEGRVFSHIVDPVTGYPQAGVVSATVIAPSAVEADAFSTALTVRPAREGINFVDTMGSGYGALIILEHAEELTYVPSSGYRRWGRMKFNPGNPGNLR